MKFQIPIKILRLDPNSFHPLVKANINGVECYLILDTGASRSVFDINAFEVTFIDNEPGKEIMPAGIIEGKIENKLGNLSNFSLKDFRLENLEGVFINLNHINNLYSQIKKPHRISGLIGSDFLVKYNAVIDFGKKRLHLSYSP